MTLAGQQFWRDREARLALPLRSCPCCGRTMPIMGAVDEVAIDVSCQTYAVSRAALLSRSRTRRISTARSLVVWALRSLGDPLSYDAIGRLLGRHGSSCVNLHQNAIALRLSDQTFADACRAVAQALEQGENPNGSN